MEMSLLTGGTGFVGAHVARALLARGERVRCLVRPGSKRDNLQGLDVELVEGDITDRGSLLRAAGGCRRVFHCAADYRLSARDARALSHTNIIGTELVLEAAARAGVERVVYTSSVGALGLAERGRAADERTPVRREDLVGNYKRSKYDAERVAEAWFRRGLPVVIVNPSTPVGELDIKPTPTGKMIVDFIAGRMPAYVDSGLNLIDVRDVAEGHVLAAEKGVPGEKYILANRNMSLREIFVALAAVSGMRAPRWKVPHWVPFAVAFLQESAARIWGATPSIPLEGVRMSAKTMFFDGRKAVRELGVPQSSVEEALGRAVEWFRVRGYERGAR